MTRDKKMQTAYLASGCFWGTQYYLEELDGVDSTCVGYMGGNADFPTYEQVKTGETGHVEAVMVMFDPQKISYRKLLERYFETHDFEQEDGQGEDIGSQYLSKIFYCNTEQKKIAEQSIELLNDMGYSVATKVEPATLFWMGEDYHQLYFEKNGESPTCHVFKVIF